jgi:hypothetical protein
MDELKLTVVPWYNSAPDANVCRLRVHLESRGTIPVFRETPRGLGVVRR